MPRKQHHEVTSFKPPVRHGAESAVAGGETDREVARTAAARSAPLADEYSALEALEAISAMDAPAAFYRDEMEEKSELDGDEAAGGGTKSGPAGDATEQNFSFEIPLQVTIGIGSARQARVSTNGGAIRSRIDFRSGRPMSGGMPGSAPGGAEAFETGATIPVAKLKAGDVLLYHGTSLISRGISFFDGTDVSHAALYLGNSTVGEAIGSGLVRHSLRESKGNDHPWILARRLKSVPTPPMDPVIKVGNDYLAKRIPYAYQQIVMLALLALVRKTSPSGVFGFLLRAVLDAAAAALNGFLRGGKELMICSEYVYRCYDEADPAPRDRYSLVINDLHFEFGETESAAAEARRMPAGRGIHPESALARLVREPEVFTAPQVEAALDEAIEPVDAATVRMKVKEVERYLELYMSEVREDRPRPVAESGADPQSLAVALQRFATALERTRERSGESRHVSARPEAFPTQLPGSIRRLFQTAADFVTPGDLYKTQSLNSLGQITGI